MQWPVPVPLMQGELFSTWLSRAALAQGCDPMVLTGTLWSKWRAWTRDLDRGVSGDRLEVLAERSGVPRLQLMESTLQPLVQAIAPHVTGFKAAWPWVLAQGSRNRRRFGGLQYCPRCLGEDPQPFFRRCWRLAWHVGCETHNCLLLDHCSGCRGPVEPHRCRAVDEVQTRCPSCGLDLRATLTTAACPEALAFQKAADDVVSTGSGHWIGSSLALPAWFAVARRCASGRVRLLSKDPPPSPLTALRFELQRPSERAVRLRMAFRAMKGFDTGSMLAFASRSRVSRRSPGTSQPRSLPSPRAQVLVERDWIRLLRRLRVGQQ